MLQRKLSSFHNVYYIIDLLHYMKIGLIIGYHFYTRL